MLFDCVKIEIIRYLEANMCVIKAKAIAQFAATRNYVFSICFNTTLFFMIFPMYNTQILKKITEHTKMQKQFPFFNEISPVSAQKYYNKTYPDERGGGGDSDAKYNLSTRGS